MRLMVQFTIPVEKGNQAVRDGTLAKTLKALRDQLRPEAAYFWTQGGNRAGMMVFNIDDAAEIPSVAEPLFFDLNAAVTFVPVLNASDLKRALEKVTAKKWKRAIEKAAAKQ